MTKEEVEKSLKWLFRKVGITSPSEMELNWAMAAIKYADPFFTKNIEGDNSFLEMLIFETKVYHYFMREKYQDDIETVNEFRKHEEQELSFLVQKYNFDI